MRITIFSTFLLVHTQVFSAFLLVHAYLKSELARPGAAVERLPRNMNTSSLYL